MKKKTNKQKTDSEVFRGYKQNNKSLALLFNGKIIYALEATKQFHSKSNKSLSQVDCHCFMNTDVKARVKWYINFHNHKFRFNIIPLEIQPYKQISTQYTTNENEL